MSIFSELKIILKKHNLEKLEFKIEELDVIIHNPDYVKDVIKVLSVEEKAKRHSTKRVEWTPEMVAIFNKGVNKNWSNIKIARKIGVSSSTVARRKEDRGNTVVVKKLPSKDRPKKIQRAVWTSEKITQVKNLLAMGKSIQYISEKVGEKVHAINYLLKKDETLVACRPLKTPIGDLIKK